MSSWADFGYANMKLHRALRSHVQKRRVIESRMRVYMNESTVTTQKFKLQNMNHSSGVYVFIKKEEDIFLGGHPSKH